MSSYDLDELLVIPDFLSEWRSTIQLNILSQLISIAEDSDSDETIDQDNDHESPGPMDSPVPPGYYDRVPVRIDLDIVEQIEERLMREAMQESERMYRFRERKPDVLLDVTVSKLDKDAKDCMCSICQEDIEPEISDVIILPCSHVFHPECIREWGRYKTECPTCRAPIKSIEQTPS